MQRTLYFSCTQIRKLLLGSICASLEAERPFSLPRAGAARERRFPLEPVKLRCALQEAVKEPRCPAKKKKVLEQSSWRAGRKGHH